MAGEVVADPGILGSEMGRRKETSAERKARRRRSRERAKAARATEGERKPEPGVVGGEEKPRLAVDVSVSYKDLDYFRRLGFEVVVHAKEAESDASWVARAKKARADIVCSNDRGVRALAWTLGMLWVDIPQHLTRSGIRHAILTRAQQLVSQDQVELVRTG